MPCSCRLSKPTDLEPDQFGSWFSELLHKVPGVNAILGPSANQIKEMQEEQRKAIVNNVVQQITPALTGPQLALVPQQSSLDQFLTQNRTILLAGGAGLAVLMLLKPRKA